MKQKNLKKITYLEYKDLIKLSKTYGQSFFILDSEKFCLKYDIPDFGWALKLISL